MPQMPVREKLENLLGVAIPFIGVAIAIKMLWGNLVHPSDLLIAAVLYVIAELGITVGFHRLLTHRSFQTSKPIEYLFAFFGSLAVQGTVIGWVADHRSHHAHTDQSGDPHSPHVTWDGREQTVLGGLWHAHTGWLFSSYGLADWEKHAPDLVEDRGMVLLTRLFHPLMAMSAIVIPGLAGYLVTGTFEGAMAATIWGGLVRIFLGHHMTWSINSICHFHGRRRFVTDDRSTNVFWLAIPTMGESWHHNHHAFPRSAEHGLGRWELDPSALVIKAMEKLGLARNVVRIPPERLAEREIAG